MSRKQASKRAGRRKAVTVLGAAGALSLAGSASAAIVSPAEDIAEKDTVSRHVITLSEEEIYDVSLATFYVFDKEDARAQPMSVMNSRRLMGSPHERHCGVSFDYLVGGGDEFVRNVEAEHLGGLEVDHQLELGRLHHRQF